MRVAIALLLQLLALILFITSNSGQVTLRQRFNIVDYGAVGDGKTLNTKAITDTIKAAIGAGGGNVYIPQGIFVTGALNLSSHIYLEFAENGELYASDDATQYYCVPSITTDSGNCDYPFIAAIGAEDVTIFGPGRINGGANDPPGHLVAYYNKTTDFLTPVEWRFPGCSGYSCRPKLILIKNCQNIQFRNTSIINSPFWTITLVQSSNILFDSIVVNGDRRWPNNDGIDPVDSYDIIIQNSNISAGDDGICVVTHSPIGMRNITVRNCTIASSSAALKITTFDKNATGIIRDVLFENIKILDTNRGIAIMPRWGSGAITNITFSGISMETRYFSDPWWGSAEPIYITSLSESPTQMWTAILDGLYFKNITTRSENGVVVYSVNEGTENPLRNVVFSNIDVTIEAWYGKWIRPSHDWRPAPPPNLFYAPTDGFYVNGVTGGSITESSVVYKGKPQTYWGACLNETNNVNFSKYQFLCTEPEIMLAKKY